MHWELANATLAIRAAFRGFLNPFKIPLLRQYKLLTTSKPKTDCPDDSTVGFTP